MMYLILLPHTLALFVMSLIHTAWLCFQVCQIFPSFFFIDKIGQKMYLFSEKVCVCFFDYISVKRVHDASLLWFPFKSILNLKILSILFAVRGVWLVLTKQIC